eukprot:CAMPEP_0183346098 /NCGR_PEP_ID=MMETSP0164_2-20130417/11309_1 /TAXON_ID=221442 /ORGANISM="Coccolithus pelagicus ssp braarudi, Strain PLY182g" /LENGTH=319 /DNA_ID=CAMNT_0025517317 /DNA_START=302 /DNA_END=1261 /DNA_ORIENTATION=-
MTGGVHEHMRAWDPEEDNIIITLLGQLGPKWSRIVQQLPGRSVSSVRNRWQRIEKGRKLREAGHESKNRCQRCGQPKRGHVCNAKLKTRSPSGSASAGGSGWGYADEGELSSPQLSREPSWSSVPQEVGTREGALCHPPAGASPDGLAATDAEQDDAAGGQRDGGLAADADDAAALEMESAAVPMLGRMRSAGRICSELGFEALAAAAMQVSAREQAAAGVAERSREDAAAHVKSYDSASIEPPTVLPLPAVSRQMSDAPQLPPFDREQSLLREIATAAPRELSPADQHPAASEPKIDLDVSGTCSSDSSVSGERPMHQ